MHYLFVCSMHDHYTNRLAVANLPAEVSFIKNQLAYYTHLHQLFNI